jgi:hypothetical protein
MISVISNALLYYLNKDEKPIPMIKEKQLCKKSKKVIFAFPKSINRHHRDQKESDPLLAIRICSSLSGIASRRYDCSFESTGA